MRGKKNLEPAEDHQTSIHVVVASYMKLLSIGGITEPLPNIYDSDHCYHIIENPNEVLFSDD